MEKFLKEHNLQDLQQARELYNSDLSPSEIEAIRDYIVTLPLDTDTSKGLYFYNKDTKQIYRFNTSLHQYRDNRLDGRDGFEILGKTDVSELNEEQLNILEDVIRNRGNIDSVLSKQGTWNEEGSLYDSDVIVNNRQTEGNNGRLDKEALQGETNRGQGNRNSRNNQGASDIETFTTPQGEVFGFVDKEVYIYLDETKITPKHP